MISGGWETVEIEQGKGSSKNEARGKSPIHLRMWKRTSCSSSTQLLTDMLIFGEAFCEMVYGPDGLVQTSTLLTLSP
jgi:hypothetical protein